MKASTKKRQSPHNGGKYPDDVATNRFERAVDFAVATKPIHRAKAKPTPATRRSK